jgi:MoaA/NifB/PqqE/SkfB family radical SAM enzyme
MFRYKIILTERDNNMAKVMNIKNKLHQKLVIDRIKETNWHIGSNAPLVVEFDTTEVCNLACPGCISEDLVCNKTSFSRERLLEIAEEMCDAGVKAVILIGGGEPLAHPAVGEFIEYLGKHDCSIGITTNGCFVDRYMDVIAKYASWTRVSMDAGTPEGFMKVRPSKSGLCEFEHIIENMRQLGKIKTGKMGYSFLIRTKRDGFGLESNIGELYAAAKLAREIGCDYFEVKPSYSYTGGQNHALVIHDKEDMDYARAQINRLNELETDNFKIIKAINLSESLNCVEHSQDKDYHKCPVAELRTLVTPSGAYICPYWRGKDKFRIGNLHDTSFSDMWHSVRRREVVDYCDPSKRCTFHCLRHVSNLEVLELISTHTDDIELVDEYDRFI